MKKTIASLLVAVLFISAPLAFAKPAQISISTPTWRYYTDRDGSGLYFDLMRKIYAQQGIKLDVSYVPWSRALHKVERGISDVVLGETKNRKNPEAVVLTHWVLDYEEITVVYRKDKNIQWNDEETLKNRTTVWMESYAYDTMFPVSMQWSEVALLKKGLEQVRDNRTVFLMDYASEVNAIIEANPEEFNRDDYVFQTLKRITPIYPAFATTAQGKALAVIFDDEMATLYKNGYLDMLYKNYGYDQYPHQYM